jgi:hypothetical protein
MVLAAPASASAWGAAVHGYIMARAIDVLPPEIKPLFDHYRTEAVIRVNDPDKWRLVGFEEEAPNHQIDFGVDDYGPYPFAALPREYGAAIEKFGVLTLTRHGLLPWRTAEQFGNLRRVFEGFPRSQPYGPDNAIVFACALAHYVQDVTQPLHAYNNYDGQLSGQTGLHSRFETQLFDRFHSRLIVKPGPIQLVPSARDFIFEIALASYRHAAEILAADKDAVRGLDEYNDQYFERFFASMRPLLEERLATAVSATASAITAAWEAAGRPVLYTETPRKVQKVRRER